MLVSVRQLGKRKHYCSWGIGKKKILCGRDTDLLAARQCKTELYIISEMVWKGTALVVVRQCGRNRILGSETKS